MSKNTTPWCRWQQRVPVCIGTGVWTPWSPSYLKEFLFLWLCPFMQVACYYFTWIKSRYTKYYKQNLNISMLGRDRTYLAVSNKVGVKLPNFFNFRCFYSQSLSFLIWRRREDCFLSFLAKKLMTYVMAHKNIFHFGKHSVIFFPFVYILGNFFPYDIGTYWEAFPFCIHTGKVFPFVYIMGIFSLSYTY